MALDKLTKVQSVGISSFIQVVGVVTATGGFVGDLTGNVTGNITGNVTGNITGTTSNASGATGDFSIADKIVHTGDTNTALRFPAADTITAETGGSERLRITSDGYARLTTANARLEWTASSGSNPFIRSIGSGQQELEFNTGGSERLRITSSGDMGLGTSSPTSFGPTFQISGTDPALLLQDTATAVDYYGMNVGNGHVTTWFDDSAYFAIGTASAISGASYTERLRITQNSNNSTTLSIGNGNNLNNNTSADRTSVKIGGTLHLEASFAGSNHKTGMYYNCSASGQSNFYQGTFGASGHDYRAAAATLNHGALKVYTDPTTSTNYSAGAQITTMVETLRCSNGFVTKPNQPAFSVRRNSSQSIAHNHNTKVIWNTEIYDVGGHFDNGTNSRFTAPVAGKYLFLGHLYIYNTLQVEAKIYKNGSIYKRFSGPVGSGGNDNPNGIDFLDIVDLSVNDYIEIFAYHYRNGDTNGASIYGGGNKETSFVGYLLG